MQPTLQNIAAALHLSWSADTAYDSSEWSKENPARGQCVVSSLVVQDYLGGDLVRYEVTDTDLNETHYANTIDGTVVDTSSSQYTTPVTMRRKPLITSESLRDHCLTDESTRLRYALLKQRVEQHLNTAL